MDGMAGLRSTSKALSQDTGRPASRRRLSSYTPTASTGPTSANPATNGKASGSRLPSTATRAVTSPMIG